MRFGLYAESTMIRSRSRVENMLLVILAVLCSVALCANRSGVIFTLTHVALPVVMVPAVEAQVFNTLMILIAPKKRT